MRQLARLAWRTVWYGSGFVLVVAAHHALDIAFTAALLMIGVGLWWERPSLGLIVPGAIVLTVAIAGRIAAARSGD